MTAVLKEFEEDEADGVWPRTVFMRSDDALQLACAAEHGFEEVYTNDRHMLEAARYFHVSGVDVLGG